MLAKHSSRENLRERLDHIPPGRRSSMRAHGVAETRWLDPTGRDRCMNGSRRGYMWADTIPIPSAGALGREIGRRRKAFGLSQRKLATATGVEPSAISRLELGGDHDVPFGVVVRLAAALELDLELRPRGSQFTPRPPTNVGELGLSPDTISALTSAAIERVDQLGSATVMLALPEFSGNALYEVVCALNRYGLSLPVDRGRVPGDRDREILRLRVVEGLTLKELARRFKLHAERVRQILSDYFGLTGAPPAAVERRRQRKGPGRSAPRALRQHWGSQHAREARE